MEPKNEFNKPLKGYSEKEQPKETRFALIMAAIALLIFLPVFHFYDGFGYISKIFERPQVVAQIPIPPVQPEPVPELDLEETEVLEVVPSRQHTLDPEGGDFQQLKPLEKLEPLKPLKPLTPVIQPPVDLKSVRRQEQALAHLPDPELSERGATGIIPKRSRDGLRAMDLYSRQPDTEGSFGVARVVIIIGGVGISQTSTQQAIQKLHPNVTLAFAPYGNSLNRWMASARKKGHELLLQLPMEPLDYPQNNPGAHTLKADANLQENIANLHWSMSRVTNYVGVMNYLGNKLLAQPASLSPIFSEISERGLLFVEDGTVKNSLAQGVAIKELVPYARGNILLDNVRSRSAIAEKLVKLAEQAKRTGVAIGVGNAFPDTIDLVAQFAQQAKKNGIEITPVSAVVKDPQR